MDQNTRGAFANTTGFSFRQQPKDAYFIHKWQADNWSYFDKQSVLIRLVKGGAEGSGSKYLWRKEGA